jgi:hypothetical protein
MALRSFWITLFVTALLFVGCGTDEPAEQVGGDAAQTEPNDGGNSDKKKTQAGKDRAKSDFDVTYITEDFIAAVSLRPSDIVTSPLVVDVRKLLTATLGEKFYEADRQTRRIVRDVEGFEQAFCVNPFQIEEVVLLLDAQTAVASSSLFGWGDDANEGSEELNGDDGDSPPNKPTVKASHRIIPWPAVIIRFGQKIDRKQLLMPVRGNVGELIEKQHAGHNYLFASKIGVGAHFPDGETVVMAPEESLKKMLTSKNVD